MIEGTDSVDNNDDNSDKNTLIMKTRVMKIRRMRIMMITSSMVKAVILNTLAISRQRGEQSYLPLPSITTCHQAPSLFLILHLSVSIHFLMSIFCFYPFSISNHS